MTSDRIAKGDYDERDVKRLDEDDAYARCFLRTLKAKGDAKKAADVVHECFKFRKSVGIWGKWKAVLKHILNIKPLNTF